MYFWKKMAAFDSFRYKFSIYSKADYNVIELQGLWVVSLFV